jgi:SAM-dependent methyltransferase
MRCFKEGSGKMEDVLNRQLEHWDSTYSLEPSLYGDVPSYAAEMALRQFKAEESREILELGCGHGRDTLFFAQRGLTVHAMDYSKTAIDALRRTAQELGLSNSVIPVRHDVRGPLPFLSESMDGCYSHMLYSMALTRSQLESLSEEVKRVLKPNGLNIFTVRTKEDPHYAKGTARGKDMYEVDGFVVHFFDMERVQSLAEGFEIIDVQSFQEGELPRKLFFITLRKESR